jgi:long-subunit fatty acid transport protein
VAFPAVIRAATIDEELAGFDSTQDIRAVGMGGATVSRARGADAVLTNPAGLAAMPESEIAASGTYRNAAVNARLGATTTDASSDRVRLGHLGLAYRPESPSWIGVGIAYGRVRDLDINVETLGVETLGDFARFDVFERRHTTGDVYALTFGVGAEVSPGIRVGVATDILEGERERSILFDARDVSNVDADLDFARFDDVVHRSISAARVRFGAEFAIVPEFAVGLTAAAPYDYDIEEDWEQITRFTFDDGGDQRESEAGFTGYRLRVPAAYEAGATFRAGAWRVSGSFAYSDWSAACYSRPPASDVPTDQFARDYRAATNLRVGAEWTAHEVLTVRAGVGLARRAYAEEDASDPTTFSVGFSTPLAPDTVLDVAYVRSAWDTLGLGVEESTHTDRLVVGARILF